MSDLKAFRIIQGDTGGYGAPSYKCDPDGNRLEEWGDICEVYDRSEVDAYLYETEEQHKHEVSLLLVRLAEKDKEIAAITAKYRDCKRELDLLKDTQAFYDGESK